MKMSIGFDVSKETLDVAFFDNNKIEHFQVANSVKGFKEIQKKCDASPTGEQMITMEATGVYHQCAAEYFHLRGFSVSVVNPLIIKRYGEMKMLRAKTDKVDSKSIAQYGFSESPSPYKQKSEKTLKIKGFLKAIDDLKTIRTQNMNRLEALAHHAVVITEVQKIYVDLNQIIENQIKQIEKDIVQLAKQEYGKQYDNLLSIPGVGDRTASAVVGHFDSMSDFESAKQLASFIGINPSLRRSGSSVRGRGAISKKGNGYLRKLFYMAALSASRYNKSCKDLYDRLLAKGKKKKIALVAVMNKLVRQVFAVVKYNREYNPNFGSESLKRLAM